MAEALENKKSEEIPEIMDSRQKAAILVVSLGADRASQIYKYLSEQEIEDLTYEVAKLEKSSGKGFQDPPVKAVQFLYEGRSKSSFVSSAE